MIPNQEPPGSGALKKTLRPRERANAYHDKILSPQPLARRSHIFEAITYWTYDAKTFIHLSQEEKTNIRGDLGSLEIYHYGTIWNDQNPA
jgi:hypothetical protein